MTKSDLISRLAKKFEHSDSSIESNFAGLDHKDCEMCVRAILDFMTTSLSNGNRFEVRGFGTFGVKHRMPKKARNPGTGDAIYLPERFVPTFKPSKIMRSRVNELTKK